MPADIRALDGDDVAGANQRARDERERHLAAASDEDVVGGRSSPRVDESIAASVSRSRGCPSGEAYDSSAPPRLAIARR